MSQVNTLRGREGIHTRMAGLLRESFLARVWRRSFGKRHVRIGLYGPPAAGKTTLANRIARDFSGDRVGVSTGVPHETRRVQGKANLTLAAPGGGRLSLDVVDTPGIVTKVDYREFMRDHGLAEAEARTRAREATAGVIEAIEWLDEVDAVLLVLDATSDPFTQANVTLLGNLEARRLPVAVAANKIDLPGAAPSAIRGAFPPHPVIPVSARNGYNVDRLYASMVERFR